VLREIVLEEKAGSIVLGSTLRLVDEVGREILVARRGAAAAGRFRVRRRGATSYVSFEFFTRKGTLMNRYVGTIRRVKP